MNGASKICGPSHNMWGTKTADCLVVLQRHCNLSTNIFKQNELTSTYGILWHTDG